MTARMIMRVATFSSVLLCGAVAMGQPASPPAPRRPASPQKTAEKSRRAPQVLTIVHRLNGLKMFRLLLRSQEQMQSISSLDTAFTLMDDVHTNVVAGLAMDDGETIAAWLPDADVEFGPFPAPDITVIGPAGKTLVAKYIGLDAVTGLSILKLANRNVVHPGVLSNEPLETGEPVLLFGPEPVTKHRGGFFNNLYVRMGTTEGRVRDVVSAPSGGVARVKVSSTKLSLENIGGVALNEAGETIGIIDGLEGTEASIIPVALIRRAANRVLEQQASVPRPWLGVRGEAIAALKLEQMLKAGWEMKRAADLAGKHRGIMLTSVLPDSPAAQAALRAGDVILKVDNQEIQNEEDFTWWLDQAGPSSFVKFTVARPDRPAEEPLSVKLSGMHDPAFSFKFRTRLATNNSFSLLNYGIETIALRPAVATQLGSTAGLLVIYVEPLTPASEAGLLPGDVIQWINGKPASAFRPTTQATSFKFDIVRNKSKHVVTVPAKKK